MQLSAWIMRGDLAQFLWNISYGAALKVMTFFMTMTRNIVGQTEGASLLPAVKN